MGKIFDSKPCSNDPPPAYCARETRLFPIVEQYFGRTLSVFPSRNAYDLYKSGADAVHQSKGYGMPLMLSKRSYKLTKVQTIYKTVKPPMKFDKHTHVREYSVVTKKMFGFKITPYFLKLANGEEIVLFYHNFLPIVDYQYRGIVYRWVNQKTFGFGYFYYTLLQMGPDRPYSLVDSWDYKEGKFNKNNEAVKWSILTKPAKWYNWREFYSGGAIIGDLAETSKFGRNQCEMRLDGRGGHPDCVDSVDDVMLVHIAVGLVLKTYEDILEQRRKNKAM